MRFLKDQCINNLPTRHFMLSKQSANSAFYTSTARSKYINRGKPKPPSASVTKSSFSLVHCQLCDKEGHLAKRCWTFLNLKKKQYANLAEAFAACSILASPDPAWYPDSGHMTNDPEGVDIPAVYSGNERVMVGNG